MAAIRARHGAVAPWRGLSTLVLLGTAIAFAAPAVFFVHRGLSTLTENGGVPEQPWSLFVFCLTALICVVIVRHKVRPDRPTNLVLVAPAILGGAGLIAFAVFESSSKSSGSYYGQKLALGAFAVCIIILACVVASDITVSSVRRRLAARPLTSTLLAGLATAAMLQIDGYVGPVPGSLIASGLATGFNAHQALVRAQPSLAEIGDVLTAAALVHNRMPGGNNGQWWYLDLNGEWLYIQSAQWFDALTGYTVAESDKILSLISLDTMTNPVDTARFVVAHFGNPATGHLHLVVPKWLASAIIHLDQAWNTPGALVTEPGSSPS